MIDQLKALGYITDVGHIHSRLVHALKKRYPLILLEIITSTNFLSPDVTTRERLYCIEHNIKSVPTCLGCNSPVNFVKRGTTSYYSMFCSNKCASSHHNTKEKSKQTNLKNIGVEYPQQNAEVWKKSRQTMLDNHGVAFPQQSKKIQFQTKQTNLAKFGVEFATQSKDVCEKRTQTFIKNYGGHPSLNKEVQAKKKQTNMEKYGGHPQQNKEVQEKTKQTNLIRYGTACSISSRQTEFIEARRQTNLTRCGTTNSSQSHMINILPLLEDKRWLFDQYITQDKTTLQLANEFGINAQTISNYLNFHKIEIRQNCWYSHMCIDWFTTITEKEHIHIQHALSGGEFKIPGMGNCHADGYCAETNTIYEFHGDYWHGNPEVYKSTYWNKRKQKPAGELYQATVARENKIKSLGYNLITVWESDYNKSKLLPFVSN